MDILKGNDFTIVWEIYKGIATNPEDFTSSKVIVFLGNIHDKQVISHTISGNTITIPVSGNKLGCGTYNIEAIWSKNQGRNWARVKKTSIFTITDNPNIVDPSITQIKIDSIAIAIGYDGLSAYELAVKKGYIGSEDDWLEGQSFANPVDNLTSTSSIDYLVANQGRVLHEKLQGINFNKATDGYTYPFKQLGSLTFEDAISMMNSLRGYSNGGHYRLRISSFNHSLDVYTNGGAVFQILTGTIVLNNAGVLENVYNMTTRCEYWRVFKGGSWSRWNDSSRCALASNMIPFDGVIDSVYVEQASHSGSVMGKVLYVKNPSSGTIIGSGTVGFPGKQFVIAVEESGKTKYFTNWSERIKYQGENLKPYPGEVYVTGDMMYHFNGTDLVPYINEIQYLEFAGVIDVVTIENVGIPVNGTRENVYYTHDARALGSITGSPGFVLKQGSGLNAKYYSEFTNKSVWLDTNNQPYRNRFYRESSGALHTFEPSVSDHLRPSFPVSRAEFDDLLSRVERIEGTGIELTPELMEFAAKETTPKVLTVKTLLDWQLKIEEQ